MNLRRVLFLAGYTVRSQTYAQAMAKAGLRPEYAILFGRSDSGLLGQLKTAASCVSLDETIGGYGWNSKLVSTGDVNDMAVYRELVKLAPRLVIYSGYGGQLVGKRLLDTGMQFLHMHSGWLPDYRGSTTLYYSWIKENRCGVSAIILNERIDEGVIVSRKRYPPPPAGVDPDYVYDCAIRADLLVSVLMDYVKWNGFRKVVRQKKSGRKYFVIHPVLKHLARQRKYKGG